MDKTHETLTLGAALAIAVVAAMAAGPARAQTGPWYVGISQTVGTDDNLLRLPAGQEQSSGTISSTSVVGGLDLRPGRQHLTVDARVTRNSYGDIPQQDFSGHSISALLEWETAGNVSGTVSAGSEKTLGSYSSFALTTGLGPNISRTDRFEAEFSFGSARTSRAWIVGAVDYRNSRNEVDLGGRTTTVAGTPFVADYTRTLRTTGAGVGFRYRLGGSLVLGAGVHTSRGKEHYDLASLLGPSTVEDDFRRNDLDLFANWNPGGASVVRARLSFGRTDVDQELLRPDRSGASGRIAWDWTPTGKIMTTTELSYESNSRDIGRTDTGVAISASEPVTALAFDATYAMTAKLTARAGLSQFLREPDGPNASGTDRIGAASLGLDWAVLRNVVVGCQVAHQTRSESSLSPGFDSTSGSCTVRAVLQ